MEVTSYIYGVATLSDGRLVACSDDCTMWIWDVETGECMQLLTGHRQSVCGVAALPAGRRALVTAPCGSGTWGLASACRCSPGIDRA